MNPRQLKFFLAVAEEGSVTLAARKLRVAQPAVSKTLQALERECGVQLFDRVGRGLRITAAGEALVGPARQALRGLEVVTAGLDQVAQLEAGRLDLGALTFLANDPMAKLIGRFRQAHEGVAVRLEESDEPGALVSLIREGICEVALVHLPVTAQDLVVRGLGRQELHIVLPPETTVPPGPITPAELAGTPFVVAPAGTSTRVLLEKLFEDAGIELRIAVETSTRERSLPLVVAGAGAALYPADAARVAANAGAVIRPPNPPITRELGFIHRQAPLSPAANAFLHEALRPQTTGSSTGLSPIQLTMEGENEHGDERPSAGAS